MSAKVRQVVGRNIYFILALLLLSVVCILFSRGSPAGLPAHLADFRVTIDGVDYGIFDRVGGFEHLDGAQPGHFRVTLERSFVAHPSLSFWARAQLSRRQMLRDISLVVAGADGVEESYVLKYCQPLSWSVEAVNPAGGYHETIALAVQEVSRL